MIDVRQINDEYHVGREKPGGKIYVMSSDGVQVASYSRITETVDWHRTVSPEEKTLIEAYLKANY